MRLACYPMVLICLAGCMDDPPTLVVDKSCRSYAADVEAGVELVGVEYRWEKSDSTCRYDRKLRHNPDSPCLFCIDSADYPESSGPRTIWGAALKWGDAVIYIDRFDRGLVTRMVFHEVSHYCGYPFNHPRSKCGDWLNAWFCKTEAQEPTSRDVENIGRYCGQ